MTDQIHEKLLQVPPRPGVYLMKNAGGEVIYVGKARNLKKRLVTYFSPAGPSEIKTGVLVKQIVDFETILTATEKEALILESNLIKRYRPRYNVDLKDDKRYPSLRLDVQASYPRLEIVRKLRKDGTVYFGPFASAKSVRETLRMIHKTFKLRKCKTKIFQNRSRPCLNYQMGLCLAPCCLPVDPAHYQEIVKEVILFLRGRTPDLVKKIRKEMTISAAQQDYEHAAALRDKIFALERTLEKQVSVTTDFKDRDILALARNPDMSVITRLFVRGGFLLGTHNFFFSKTLSTDQDTMSTFIRQYFEKGHFIPAEILLPFRIDDAKLLEDLLSREKGKRVRLLFPEKGEKARLVEMAVQNADNSLKERMISITSDLEMLGRLQRRLDMKRLPIRIECIDNSMISGTAAVASLVVFESGRPNPSAYRRYQIKSVITPDDYACMAEVVNRRFGKPGKDPLPDLLMVDGGKGQLNLTVALIRRNRLEGRFEIVGIAKKDSDRGDMNDKIYKFKRVNPVIFGKDRDLLLFLQRIRDEAHRFAIAYHRRKRSKETTRSVLDEVPGIGKKRKEALLIHFGSMAKIRSASVQELSCLPAMTRPAAEAIKQHLGTQPGNKTGSGI